MNAGSLKSRTTEYFLASFSTRTCSDADLARPRAAHAGYILDLLANAFPGFPIQARVEHHRLFHHENRMQKKCTEDKKADEESNYALEYPPLSWVILPESEWDVRPLCALRKCPYVQNSIMLSCRDNITIYHAEKTWTDVSWKRYHGLIVLYCTCEAISLPLFSY